MKNNLKNNLKNKKKKGFTLIELIIVIAIIAIIAAIALPKFGEVRKNANINADIANAKQIQGAVSMVIAEGKVDLPTAEFAFTLDGTSEGTDKIEAAAIEQLQGSTPKLKAVEKGSFFKVTVTTDGKTTVSTPNGVQVYPQPTTGTGTYVEK